MKIKSTTLLLLASFSTSCYATLSTTFQPFGVPFQSPVTTASGFSSNVLFSNLTAPRGITLDEQENILVVERGFGVTAFNPTTAGWERTVVITNPNFTQGIQLDGHLLYISTASDVHVYHYNSLNKSVSNSDSPDILITGLPPDGDLTTHTLQLQKDGTETKLLIASGPLTNIDPTARDPSSGRSQIRMFVLPHSKPTVPLRWSAGEILAYGIRNPAGFAFHPPFSNQLYVVENGPSIDNVTGLTPTFVNDNPADELNLVSVGGNLEFYGFPDCAPLWNPSADPIGDPQYVKLKHGDEISLLLESERNDTWCMSPKNNVPPVLNFQAHSVPLDIKFYEAPTKPSATSFPSSFNGDAVVSFHGSFNRVPPTGYGVVHVPFPLHRNYSFLVQATNLTSCPGTCIRPVGLAFSRSGVLYVSSDSSGELFAIQRS